MTEQNIDEAFGVAADIISRRWGFRTESGGTEKALRQLSGDPHRALELARNEGIDNFTMRVLRVIK